MTTTDNENKPRENDASARRERAELDKGVPKSGTTEESPSLKIKEASVARNELLREIEGKTYKIWKDIADKEVKWNEWLDRPDMAANDLEKFVLPHLTPDQKNALELIIKNLRSSIGTKALETGKAALKDIVGVIEKREREKEKTREATEKIDSSIGVRGAKGIVKDFWRGYQSGSKEEKVAILGSLGVVAWILFAKHEGNLGKVTGFLRTSALVLAGVWGVDTIGGRIMGKKSLLRDTLGLMPTEKELPHYYRSLAEAAKLERADEFISVMKLNHKKVSDLYSAYQEAGTDGEIDPALLGFYNNEIEGKTIYDLMDALVKKVKFGKLTGREAFEKKYLQTAAGEEPREWEFWEVAYEEFKLGLTKKEREAISNDLLGQYLNTTILPITVSDDGKQTYIKGVPVKREESTDKQELIFSFETEDGPKEVNIPLKPENMTEERKQNVSRLIDHYANLVMQRLTKNSSLTKKKTPTWDTKNNRWIVKNVTFAGKKRNVIEIKPLDDRNVQIKIEGIDVGVAAERMAEGELEKMAYLLEIQENYPTFEGLDIQLTEIKPIGDKVRLNGFIAGTEFEMMKQADGAYKLRKFDFSAPAFLHSLQLQVEKNKTIQAIYDQVTTAAEIAPESHFKKLIAPFFGEKAEKIGVSGTFPERLWQSFVQLKKREAIQSYLDAVTTRADELKRHPEKIKEIQASTIGQHVAEMESLLNRFASAIQEKEALTAKLHPKIGMVWKETFSDQESATWLEELSVLGYKSNDYRKFMKDLRFSLEEQNFDFEGFDHSDLDPRWAEAYSIVLQIASERTRDLQYKETLTDEEKAYLNYVHASLLTILKTLPMRTEAIGQKVIGPYITKKAILDLRSHDPNLGIFSFETARDRGILKAMTEIKIEGELLAGDRIGDMLLSAFNRKIDKISHNIAEGKAADKEPDYEEALFVQIRNEIVNRLPGAVQKIADMSDRKAQDQAVMLTIERINEMLEETKYGIARRALHEIIGLWPF